MLAAALLLTSACRRATPEQLYQQAHSEFEHGQLDAALRDADAGLKRFAKSPGWVANFENLRAETLIWKGEIKAVEPIMKRPLDASAPLAARARRSYLACIYNFNKGRSAELQRSVAELEALSAQQPQAAIEAHLCRGMIDSREQMDAALDEYRQAFRLAQQSHRTYDAMAAIGNIISIEMRLRRFDPMIADYARLTKLNQEFDNPIIELKSKGTMATAYMLLGDYEMGEAMNKESLRAAERLGLIKDQCTALNSLGVAAQHDNRYAEAISYYEKAYELGRQHDLQQQNVLSLSNIAMAAVEFNQADKAEKYLRLSAQERKKLDNPTAQTSDLETSAMIAARRGHPEQAVAILRQTLATDDTHDVYRNWELHTLLGESYGQMKKNADALAAYAQALRASDANRQQVKNNQGRITFTGRAEWLYNDYIDELTRQGRTREALAVAEHSHTRSLEDGLQNFSARSLAFNPEAAARRNNAVILEYWESKQPNSSQTYLWVVTPRGVELKRLGDAAHIDELIRSYRKALTGLSDPLATGNKAGRELFDLLVGPVADRIPAGGRVILVTSGALSGLNFETLIRSTPQPHYWIEDVTILNAPAISYLQASGQQRETLRGRRLLLMGDAKPASIEFPPLRHAGEEIARVEGHFPAASRTILRGDQARPSAYAGSHAGDYGYLHFVTHGTASTTEPLESSIILSPEGDGQYKLYAQAILKQRLRAHLVTISACYGAGVRSYVGEGLVGLSWAFLRAGAHNVIASMWEVNDASTPMLMDELYGSLQRTGDAAASLRAAKLSLLRSRTIYRKPFYWAAFQLYSGS